MGAKTVAGPTVISSPLSLLASAACHWIECGVSTIGAEGAGRIASGDELPVGGGEVKRKLIVAHNLKRSMARTRRSILNLGKPTAQGRQSHSRFPSKNRRHQRMQQPPQPAGSAGEVVLVFDRPLGASAGAPQSPRSARVSRKTASQAMGDLTAGPSAARRRSSQSDASSQEPASRPGCRRRWPGRSCLLRSSRACGCKGRRPGRRRRDGRR